MTMDKLRTRNVLDPLTDNSLGSDALLTGTWDQKRVAMNCALP